MKPLFDDPSGDKEADQKANQAGFACGAIHMAITMLLAISLLAIGVMDNPFLYTLMAYMLLGWIPLRIWLYPILLKRMK